MKTLLTFLGVVFSFTIQAQIAYHDAVVLKRHMTDTLLDASSDTVFMILDKYVQPSVHNNRQQILDALQATTTSDGNPFLEISGTDESDVSAPIKRGITTLATAAGGLNVTNLADGLAQFLIERSKEELSVAFFEQFKKDLQKIPELKVLFPATSSFIENIEAYNYASFIQTLREGFYADLVSLPSGLKNLKNLTESNCPENATNCKKRLKEIEEFFKKDTLSVLFVASTIMIDSLHAGANIANIIKAVANDEQTNRFRQSNISNALILSDIFSSSLRSKVTDKVWIGRDELLKLKDIKTLKIYFGLIYQQLKEKAIMFTIKGQQVRLDKVLKIAHLNLYFNYLENVVSGGAEINRVVKEIRRKKENDEQFTADDYVNYLNASVDAVSLLVNWEVFRVTPPPRAFHDILTITRSSISIYYNIRGENYSSAISNLFIILDQTLKDTYQHKEKILRYGSFMASIVQAESGEQVKEAIEAVALPAGSASIKKNSQWNISLNSYLGGFTGREYLADKITDKWDNTRGVSAPIGLGVSHRLWTASLTGFVSLLDIGTVVSYRLNDPTTEKLPELKLQNLFAPGAGLILGFPRWPVSVGYLTQVGPALREIDPDVATVAESVNRRYYFFLAVDIPLMNFFTKPKTH